MHFKHTLLQIDNKTINHIEFLKLYWYHFDYCQMFLDFICSNLSGFNKNLNIQFLLSFSYKLILKLCLLSLHFVLVDQEFSVSSAAVSTVASQQIQSNLRVIPMSAWVLFGYCSFLPQTNDMQVLPDCSLVGYSKLQVVTELA